MAVDFNGQVNALNYAYYTLGNSRSGSSLVTMGSPLSVFARVNMSGNPGGLGAFVGGCVNVPPGLGGYNKEGLLITTSRFVRAWAGGNPGVQTADSATPIPLNTWTAIGVSIAQNSLKAYIDGVAGTENTTAWSGGTLEETIIGAYPTTNSVTFARPFSHCIEDLAIWADVQLTDEQQAELTTLFGDDIKNYSPAPTLYIPFANSLNADDAFLNGSPIDLYFKTYNSDPEDTTATVETCATSPEQPGEESGEVPDECGSEDEPDPVADAITWGQCELVPSGINVDIVSPTVSPGRSFTGIEKVVHPDAGHWRIIYHDVPVRTREEVLRWREIELLLSGRTGTILVPVYEGKLSDTPIAATVPDEYPIGSTIIAIEQTAGEALMPGMNFSFGDGQLHRIARIIEQETGETYEVSIRPPLRTAIDVGQALDFNTPSCRCRLASDDGMNIDLGLLRYGSRSVEFVEDV